MGGIKDSTYLDVQKALSRRFSPQDGWQFAWSSASSAQPEGLLSRRVAGRTERVLVNVKMASNVPAGTVQALEAAASAGKADRAVLVVPGGAAVPEVPEGVDVLEMGNWQIVGGRIAWAKNIERSAFLEEERARRGLA
ncbi:hypothetical protein [Methanoculleus chikugoensis]|uniref:Uncharacterized protein n=1 Tax=Methanoculleus chikugoensis TaxID=118126 RepID=A0ABN5XG74_9EURY|nr:hypothetical protein [Methanoculleus chikugoensis]BBL67750.1 hypothetical protein MchiMG62_09310 [Methanoculleus chikugoensis]